MNDKTEIKGLTFEDFKKLTMEKVREDNHLDLVESWEDNILNCDFYENSDRYYYSTSIYFIEETRGTGYYLKRYRYSYCSEILYEDGYEVIDKIALKKIALLEDLISKNNESYLYSTLKKFKECASKIQ